MNTMIKSGDSTHDLLPKDLAGFNELAELALDLRWSWNHAADELWQQLDPALWALTHNPWVVLQSASHNQIEQLLGEPAFRTNVDALLQAKRRAAERTAWFQQTHPQSSLGCVAYFCMEFMLSEALPIYSGGLGNVAGDQLKAASDLGVPVVGVGLLYSEGYFRQVIDSNGAQQALYPYNDPGQLPITPLRGANGEWLRLKIELPGYPVLVRAWQVQVGRAKLYLLDSNDAANVPVLRGITSKLYGGTPELRLQQELLLGIGGWRLLAALGIKPDVCHLNEGHAAFAVLERARSFMEETGESFAVALNVTRAGNLFTTHTAVEAGFDRFDPALIERYLGSYAELKLGVTRHDLLALGRHNPDDSSESFNMAYLALRGSSASNGVSRLHGEVSRKLFAPLFEHWPVEEVPVNYVTNGVHTPSWDSAEADYIWTERCGKDRWLGATESLAINVRCITDSALWSFRNRARESLVAYARERLSQLLTATGAESESIETARHVLDPNVLTLGFARRFATYKRPNLLLRDPERLMRLLTNPARPVQLILAGKAHPADKPGQALIQQWTTFIRNSAARQHVVFLSDYDMRLTEQLVQGVDVWLNTPRRPWEACGTSGMKVLVNGGINLSELDGWWAEAYTPEVGWALGDGQEHGDDPVTDEADANALYDLLEREVIPEFYTRGSTGIPERWMARIRSSMSGLTPRFSTNRTVREYTEKYYLPMETAYKNRSANKCALGKHLASLQAEVQHGWSAIRIDSVNSDRDDTHCKFDVHVALAEIDPDAVCVQIYADAVADGGSENHNCKLIRKLSDSNNDYLYSTTIQTTRTASDFTARVVPGYGVSVPLEDKHILWQR